MRFALKMKLRWNYVICLSVYFIEIVCVLLIVSNMVRISTYEILDDDSIEDEYNIDHMGRM